MLDYKVDFNKCDAKEKAYLLEIVKQHPYAIKNIKNASDEMKLEALMRNGLVIGLIDKPTEEMKLIAVREDGFAIKCIDEQTEELQIEAVTECSLAIDCIKNPCAEAVKISKMSHVEKMKYFCK